MYRSHLNKTQSQSVIISHMHHLDSAAHDHRAALDGHTLFFQMLLSFLNVLHIKPDGNSFSGKSRLPVVLDKLDHTSLSVFQKNDLHTGPGENFLSTVNPSTLS